MKIFIYYTISGGLAALVHFLILIALVEKTTINPTIASGIGFCMAIIVNYNMQYHWTFKSSGSHRTIFIKYVIVTFIMLGVNTIIFWFLFEKQELVYLIAQVIATGTVMLMNFAINKNYTFASSKIKLP